MILDDSGTLKVIHLDLLTEAQLKEYLVQVEFEDMVLVEFALDFQREKCFLDLARDRTFGRQEQVLGELLRDRAAALHDAPGAQVDDHGAGKADRIDARMVVEAPILGGDHGLRKVAGQFVEARKGGGAHTALGDDLADGRGRPGAGASTGGQSQSRRTGATAADSG